MVESVFIWTGMIWQSDCTLSASPERTPLGRFSGLNLDSLTTLLGTVSKRRPDRWAGIGIFLVAWTLFGAIEQRPFLLQGAVIEALVERGRLHFIRGNMNGIVFDNLDTNTPSFRHLFNIFPHGGVYHVNHAPGQFLLAAPWYAAAVKLGWRFETHEWLVWRFLVWTLTAPLGALAVVCVFLLARAASFPWPSALFSAAAFALCSPWWPASGVLYHDSIAVALILMGATVWCYRPAARAPVRAVCAALAGSLLAYSIVTTYLVIPIVLLICGSILASRPPRREILFFGCGFLPIVAFLPLVNVMSFGSPFATGYSVGGFDENYPSPLDISNVWEKVGFYLWNREYGLLWLFPLFALAVCGLAFKPLGDRAFGNALLVLAAVHFLFIVSMRHHGSVGWGMGRFFLPLYPVLALGIPGIWFLEGWKGHVARAVMLGAAMYSAVFAAAGACYGIQGIMEPGVPSLKLRLLLSRPQAYEILPLLAIVTGTVGALALQPAKATKTESAPQRGKRRQSAGSRQRRFAKPKTQKPRTGE